MRRPSAGGKATKAETSPEVVQNDRSGCNAPVKAALRER
jgi:hypothetical protein